jgi:DNA-binding transcriptional regulator YiaG
MHHYTESGLDYVYLESGYSEHDTPYGKGVSIQNTEDLHRMIGKWIVSLPRPLTGAELRFLRLELEMSQRILADILNTEEQTLRRWEKARAKPFNGSADRLLRALYNECELGDGSVKRMVERLAGLDVKESIGTLHFRETKCGWQPVA